MANVIGRYGYFVAACCVLLGAMCAGIGCDVKPVSGKVGTPLQYQEKIIAKDFILHDRMRVANHKAGRTDSGLLTVKVGLDNTEKEDIWCDIQVVFYDEDNFELEKTNWQPLLLLGKQITYYDTVSLSNRACDYTIFLRNPRESRGIE